MENLQIFRNEEFGQVRTVNIKGEPWFVGKDISRALGYGEGKSLNNAVANHVDEEDKGVVEMMTPGGKQKVTIINESGLYALIFGSRLESAKRFKHWVTSEVLPALRKTGHYIMPGYERKATSIGEVVNMLKLMRRSMKERGCSEEEIARAMDGLCQQFGIQMPREFLEAAGYGEIHRQKVRQQFVDIFSEVFSK